MTHHGPTGSRGPGPERREPKVSRRPSAELHDHPKRMEGLTRRLAHCQEELWGMQREAIIALEDAISQVGALDRCSRQGLADELLSELESALDKVGILDNDTLPRPEHLFAIADRLSRFNQVLPASSGSSANSEPRSGC